MFHDQAQRPDLQLPTSQNRGTSGKRCQLLTNNFRIVMNPEGAIYHYRYTVTPAATSAQEERWIVQSMWTQLQGKLSAFVVRCPGNVFSPTSLSEDFVLNTPEESELGYAAHEVSVKMFQTYSADLVNRGLTGDAQVVMQYIAKKLADSLMYQKVGRRYYDADGVDRASMAIFTSFFAALDALNTSSTHLQIDTMYRLMAKKSDGSVAPNVVEVINRALDSGDVSLSDPDVQAEWRKRCNCATVLTTYNNRFYRIKAVRFDMSPKDVASFYIRDEKKHDTFSYAQYYQAYYHRNILDMDQPMLEAFAEKDSEKVFLVPELCALTGFSDEMRNNKNLMLDALKAAKVSPQERYEAIMQIADGSRQASDGTAVRTGIGLTPGCQKVMGDWNFTLDRQPVEVQGRVLDKLDVIFIDSDSRKRFVIEDGSFQRWMRNGLQCPINLQDWLLIYPETDASVVDIWLRSLRDIAQVAFSMTMSDPTRIICTNQKEDIVRELQERLTPTVQLVLLLTPHRDSKKVYQLFKQTTCLKLPCITQVVKSETIRKRQSIAAVLSRIVLQINAKCGPMWHIDPKCDNVRRVFDVPTMVVGIDVYQSPQGDRYYGFAASTNKECTQYWSTGAPLTPGAEWASKSEHLQDAFRNAVLHFSRRNDGLLPSQVIVYRASAAPEEWTALRATEVEAILRVLRATQSVGENGEEYDPKLTYICLARRCSMRFFAPMPTESAQTTAVKNPEPGTVIDSDAVNGTNMVSFYLVSQGDGKNGDGKGTVCPTHYMVLYDSCRIEADTLQKLSYWLSFLYYNFTGSVKMPAPAQYAKTIARLVGTAVFKEPHKRLQGSLFYL